MIGLVYKDLMVLKKHLRYYLIFLVVYGGMTAAGMGPGILGGVLCIVNGVEEQRRTSAAQGGEHQFRKAVLHQPGQMQKHHAQEHQRRHAPNGGAGPPGGGESCRLLLRRPGHL